MKAQRPHKTDLQYETERFQHNKQVLDALTVAASPLATPGWRRWSRAMRQIEAAMLQIESEMEAYYDRRTKPWKRSRHAYALIERLNDLQTAKDAVVAWLEYIPTDRTSG